MKGVDVLIKAVAKLTFDFKLIIVGRDSETGQAGADYLRQLAKELQVSDKIIFIRELSHSDLIDLYKIADLFVLPTRKDHTPKVMVEAGLMSKAMITTTSCGFSKDLIEEGISGYVVATDDVDALAAALNKCQDREKLQRFGERSRELVQHLCDPEKETAGFVEAIERVRGYK
jgi:glycosyltransferase involved in cell wall biosynthesis